MTQFNAPISVLQRAFPGIPDQEAEELAAAGIIHFYPPQAVLCQEDDQADTFFVILEGQVQVSKAIDPDTRRILKNLGAGDFFGEMALIHNARRAATVKTLTPTTVMEIHKADFDRLVERSASLSLALARETSRRLRENDAMAIEDLRLKAGELAVAYQKLAEQEFARREFLNGVSRELRQPLGSAASGLQDVIYAQPKGKELAAALSGISLNLEQVIGLVNDILFLQDLELILPVFASTDVGAILRRAIQQAERGSDARRVRSAIPHSLPRVQGDAHSLERAFSAVLDNALKFSPEGGQILVEAQPLGSQVWVRISDPGVGIPAEALPHVFERFFHLDKVGNYPFSGLGLGLAIAHQVIAQHNGQIKVESQPGRGTTVTLTLPSI